MSLRTGTQLITLAFLINKLTGVYGLLSILTGYHVSKLQLSMYIYSLVALAFGAHLAQHIRKGPQSPLQNLALAWLYLIDSAVNALYTMAFGLSWFLVLAQSTQPPSPSSDKAGSGKATMPVGQNMMEDVAGFTNPSHTVSAVDVIVTSAAPGTAASAHLVGKEGSNQSGASKEANAAGAMTGGGALTTVLLSRESLSSLITIGALWLLRIYSILVILAYARSVVRQHIVIQSQASNSYSGATPIDKDNSSALRAENPFAQGSPAGAGWRGALGRTMVGFGKGYWLGIDRETESSDFDEEWARILHERFGDRRGHRRSHHSRSSIGTSIGSFSEAQAGAGERERRRRAGTGPPPPSAGLGVNTPSNAPDASRSGSVPNLRPIELGDMGRK